MQILGLACLFAHSVAALIVGVRLVWLARRTRGLPELMIGGSLLCGAMVGHPANVASGLLASESSPLAWPVAAAGSIGLAVATAFSGMIGLFVALCLTDAFYPPKAYLRRIRERAGLEVS